MLARQDVITGPMGIKYGSDPTAHFLAFVKANRAKVINLLRNAARTSGVSEWKVPDRAAGRGDLILDMVPRASDSDTMLTAKFVAWILKDPATLKDEALRASYGLPYRGFDGQPMGVDEQPAGDDSDKEMWNAINTGVEQAGNVFSGIVAAISGDKPPKDGRIEESRNDSGGLLLIGIIAVVVLARTIK